MGGLLSYDKMIYETNIKHYREQIKENDKVENKPYSCCRTSTGWLTCKKHKKGEAKKEEHAKFGLGMAIYFKQLKALVILFLVLSIISIPCYITYYYGTPNIAVRDSKNFFSMFTLGNLGQTTHLCSSANNTVSATITNGSLSIICPFGQVASLDKFVLTDLSLPGNSCGGNNPAQQLTNYTAACDQTKNPNVTARFNSSCLGKEFCNFTMPPN